MGSICVIRERLRATKRLNITGPSTYFYKTDVILIVRAGGLEQIGVGKCVIAV